ncbi:DNA repair protein RecO [Fusibacter paucivorans]|uniref:DNA repair protein RecO n=1 Tax=Fusibacter paucivorans TaxID=76009 RepID=A0ABS5PNL1_9FIRM|nr:DNA repair protein RecO [Fusibacter paucivorans]MBS7526763.1 DNA repair protein RecO [Fusibacter paucivorans]
MYFETDAIVIKTVKAQNNDIFLTLFTKKAGKMEAVAMGAKSSRNHLAAASKPFVFGQFVLNTKSKTPKVQNVSIYDSHFRITDDLNTLAYGYYFLELCNYTIRDNMSDIEHFQLLAEIIDLLAKQQGNYRIMRCAYLIKLTQFTGHFPNLSNQCTVCQSEIDDFYFSIEDGGLICEHCRKEGKQVTKLNRAFIDVINYLHIKDIRISAKTKIHEGYLSKLINLFESYHQYHNQIYKINALDFLNSLIE